METSNECPTDVEEIKKCKTLTDKLKMESELGCRYSVLLPNWIQCIIFTLVNLKWCFIGFHNILSPAKIAIINKRLKRIHIPIEIGCFPVNIQSGATFTAEQ